MVLALAGTDGCGALYPKSQKENRAWLQSPTPTRPRREMANFNTLLGWIQRPELLEGPAPKLSDEDCRNLKRLNELRRQFAHYNPTGWGVELQYMLNIMPAAANLFEHLTTTQGRPNLHFTMGHKRRMRKSLAAIRRLVAEKMKQSSQGSCASVSSRIGISAPELAARSGGDTTLPRAALPVVARKSGSTGRQTGRSRRGGVTASERRRPRILGGPSISPRAIGIRYRAACIPL
jgi:hypothetical protein